MRTINVISLLIVVFAAVTMSHSAHAGYCFVTTESDSSSNTSALRGVIKNTVNDNALSNCTMRYYDSAYSDDSCTSGTNSVYHCTNDYKHFSQGIIFETPEEGGSVETITLGSAITIDSYSRIVIGNPSLEMLTDSTNEVEEARNGTAGPYDDGFLIEAGILLDSEDFDFYGYNEDFITQYFTYDWDGSDLYDYGQVVIDATGVTGVPFKCGADYGADVFLRGLTIVSESSYSTVFGDGTDTVCLKDGGDVSVCTEAKFNADTGKCKTIGIFTPPDGVKPGGGIDPGDDDDDDCTESTWYADADADGYGDASVSTEDCDQPTGYVSNDEDCDDTNNAINPSADESAACDDVTSDGYGIDNDCDGYANCYDDACFSANVCNAVGQESDCADSADNDGDTLTDCDDADCSADSACYDDNGGGETGSGDPDLGTDTELECEDGIDDDSDAAIDCDDSDCSTAVACADVDADGDGMTINDGDCDDTNADISPETEEICIDLTDNDCDGVIDETSSCVEPDIVGIEGDEASADGIEGDEASADSAGGCGCDLKSRNASSAQAVPALMALIPFLAAFGLRARAGGREKGMAV